MKVFVYTDFYNLMWRNAFTAGKTSDVDEKIGMMMHQMLEQLRYAYRKFEPDHLVICVDKNSWRKRVYSKYKLNRKAKRLEKTPKEQEEDEEIMKAGKDFFEFFKYKTWLPTIEVDGAEADDVIATSVLTNTESKHIIMSTDTDYYQLVDKNVLIFNPSTKVYITKDGYFDENFDPVIDKKTNLQKHLGDPKWQLFKKCIRGDSSDNIKTAYPRVREKGTKNKVGLKEAFDDMNDRGYAWHSIMEHEWEDGFSNKHKVKDLYERNKQLIDFEMIPTEVSINICKEIINQFNKKDNIPAKMIGFNFMKFCSKWELHKIAETKNTYIPLLT